MFFFWIIFINSVASKSLSHSKSKVPSLYPLLQTIQTKKFVDLTHSFNSSIPHWKGFSPEQRTTLYYYDEMVGKDGFGFYAQQYQIPGQWGTHVDPPAHFIKGNRFVDEIDVKEMILPLVVIDVSQKVQNNSDYILTMGDIQSWEKRYRTKIPSNSFVVMRTDWSLRWPSSEKMNNFDSNGVPHYPGWSLEVLKYLYETRNITASGHETTDTDPGISTYKDDYSLESYILSQNKFQIELLTNIDKVPEFGAIAIVTFPKPYKGSGFPARVFAILP